MNFEEVNKQESMWRDLVSRGEILSLQLLAQEAKKDLEKRIASFLLVRKKTIELGHDSFEFRNKTYSTDTETRD